MASSRQITGGTGDVNPQILTTPIVNQTAANAFTEAAFPLPINRFPETSGKVVVLELLKVWFFMSEADSVNSAGGNNVILTVRMSTASLPAINANDPRVIATQEKVWRGSFTAGGTAVTSLIEPQEINLTDGAGHGVLVATDSMFLGIVTFNFTAAGSFFAKILYRFKRVSLQEYIGIVQSQQ